MIHTKDSIELLNSIIGLGSGRHLIAITGSPGAGKSTLVERVLRELNAGGEELAVVVPMDGYHFDNAILKQNGWEDRKGAPYTFDVMALARDLERILANDTVFVPVFDRVLDCSRGFAREVRPEHQYVLVEGNYLCCQDGPWPAIGASFSLHIHIEVDRATLRQRLIQRWLDHNLDQPAAVARTDNNDMRNVDWVSKHNRKPDILYCPS
ncbi:ArgK protein [Neorhodopirellula lusitana]|uniref:ArgK protein n=1 Tax=Neorhodopirellula lusitana TaxID=445327 RepID=A0ABY1QMU7_9BACT|nr:GTP-binding protein [Neorhodopirellula lusitana]SMP75387.1 ArgK protein [Neorhodopirellula lusitana]